MKKQLAALLALTMLPVMLTGFGKSSADAYSAERKEQANTEITDNSADRLPTTERRGIEIIIDKQFFPRAFERVQPSFPGVRKRFGLNKSGTYTVEYIHTPFGTEKDETLDYRLVLSDDNTYSMEVTMDGVTAVHSGKWYSKYDTLMLFYDEQTEPPAHNIYVADSMYCDILPQGKLLIYDRGYTVVLAESNEQQAVPMPLLHTR